MKIQSNIWQGKAIHRFQRFYLYKNLNQQVQIICIFINKIKKFIKLALRKFIQIVSEIF